MSCNYRSERLFENRQMQGFRFRGPAPEAWGVRAKHWDKSLEVRRTYQYAAATRDESNAANGSFRTVSYGVLMKDTSGYSQGERERKESSMSGLWILLVVMAVWFLLQAVIFPKMGIST